MTVEFFEGAPDRRVTSKRDPERDYACDVIVWGREEVPNRGGMLSSLVKTERAEDVFPPELRARTRWPRILAVGIDDPSDAHDLARRLGREPDVLGAYVAPDRSPDGGGRRGPASSGGGSGPAIDQWGLGAIRWDLAQRPDASSIRVGIVDTGVDQGHPELVNALDPYQNHTNDPDDDEDGHGTHVAGIIAAHGVFNAGIAGTSNARLCVYKAISRPYRARYYYRALAAALRECAIVNLSITGGRDRTEELLMTSALASGTIIIAAAGNDPSREYPAKVPGVIAVGAVDRTLARAAFSNTGAHLSLCAPGVAIWSTSPRKTCSRFKQTVHAPEDGTSMAAPFVSAAVALLRARDSTLTATQVEARLLTSAAPPGGRDTQLGRGVLDLEKTLA